MKKIFVLTILILQLLFQHCSADEIKLNYAFWEKFQDEILINNILKAHENNPDLKIANSKIQESEKIIKLELSQELPQISFDGLIGRTFASSVLERGSNNFQINNYKQTRFLLPLNASWELDIWGKNRLKTKSKKQSLKIIEQDKKATTILLECSVASNYYNLIKTDKLIELDEKLLNLLSNLLDITQKKKLSGLATNDDILAIKQMQIETKQSINNLKNKKETIENQLGYLLGDKFFVKIKRENFDNIKITENIPMELNSSIILNRPDVISAKENIIKANYEARIAKKELLPSFAIVGSLGFNGYNNFSKLFSSNTGLADIWITPNLNIFDGNKKYNLMKLKKLEYKRAQIEYEKAILASIQEVNDSLVLLKNENKNHQLSKDILDIQKEKTRLKLANKNFGLASEIDYILYQTAQILAQEKYVSDKINYIISMINLYKAVGGVDYSENL